MQRQFLALRRRLTDLAGRREFQRPLERLRERERRLDEQGGRLKRAIHARLDRGRREAESAAGRLESLSPLNVLARGYSLTRTEASPALIRSPEQVQAGERLITTVQHGRIISRVESSEVETGPRG